MLSLIGIILLLFSLFALYISIDIIPVSIHMLIIELIALGLSIIMIVINSFLF